MKSFTLLLATSIGITAAAIGCGDDTSEDPTTSSTTGTTTTTTTTSGGGAGGGTGGNGGAGGGVNNPPPPVLGAQIERMGRPAINTAANNAFNGDSTAKGMAKDAWNAGGPATWTGNVAAVASSLAILDALDANCGNQLLADPGAPGPMTYALLATVLSDDRLWIKTDAASCGVYLAVEANATQIVVNADCGGRSLDYDVIETSYSVLAAGILAGVDDTIDADPVKTGGTTFPFLAAP